jgi:F-type H+-transporting ATPase subunit delta
MSQSAVARRYASALSELSEEKGALDAVAADLSSFRFLLASHPVLAETLENPAFSREERRAVVDRILARGKAHGLSRNFLFLLVDKNRVAALPEIVDAFSAFHDARRGRVRAVVTSAVPLDRATLSALEAQVKKLSSAKEVLLDTRVDPAILGGIVTRVGDTVFDGSIRTQLSRMKHQLLGQAAEA